MTAKKTKKTINHANGDLLYQGMFPIEKIRPSKFNSEVFGPRSTEDEENFSASTSKYGILVPITIDQDGILIDGENRWSDARKADKKEMSVVMLYAENEAARKDLAINIQICRRHMSTKDRRRILKERYQDRFNNQVEMMVKARKENGNICGNTSSIIKEMALESGLTYNTMYADLVAEVNEILEKDDLYQKEKQRKDTGINGSIIKAIKSPLNRQFKKLHNCPQETIKEVGFILKDYLKEVNFILKEIKDRR